VSTALTRAAVGGGPIYGLRTFSLASGGELVAFAAVGILAGLVGPAFLVLLDAGARAFRASRLPRPAQGALGGLVVGLLAAKLPEVTGNGYESIRLMLEARLAATTLLVLLGAKAIATAASVSSGSPGGVFTPSLYLGAALGGLVAAAVGFFPQLPRGDAGGYALVGMAALIAATTHAPLMGSVLVFELTGDYAIVLPHFVATSIATVIARRLRPGSIYTEELRRREREAGRVDRRESTSRAR
jgi:CIC family chloride channel protein